MDGKCEMEDLNPTARWLVRYWRHDKPCKGSVEQVRRDLRALQRKGKIDAVAARVRNGATVDGAIYAELNP